MGATEAVASAVEKFGEIAEMLLKPRATRALGKAEAEVGMIRAKAEVEAATLRTQARRRAELDEVRHYVNLTDTLAAAKAEIEFKGAKALLPEKAGEGKSDPDWFHKWASYAKETSDEDIRALWAKALAGEIIQPGKFSLRVLQTIGLLRKSDAVKFSTLCNYVWTITPTDIGYVFSHATNSSLFEREVIDNNSLILLDELGLLDSLNHHFPDQSPITIPASYCGRSYVFRCTDLREIGFKMGLTSLGRELFALCDQVPDEEYLKLLKTSFEPGVVLEHLDRSKPEPDGIQQTVGR